jgi:hypothetical protein
MPQLDTRFDETEIGWLRVSEGFFAKNMNHPADDELPDYSEEDEKLEERKPRLRKGRTLAFTRQGLLSSC